MADCLSSNVQERSLTHSGDISNASGGTCENIIDLSDARDNSRSNEELTNGSCQPKSLSVTDEQLTIDKLDKLSIHESSLSATTISEEDPSNKDGHITTTTTQTESLLDYYYGTKPTKEKTSQELDYVLEVYGFNPSLKTKDLLQELLLYGPQTMKLKWVDDTHALAIYASIADAKIVVKGTYTNIKVRLLRQSTNNESFIMAEKVAASIRESLESLNSLERPSTTANVARRMIGHALGVKINVTPEQREKEREELKLAKAMCSPLLLEKKQRKQLAKSS